MDHIGQVASFLGLDLSLSSSLSSSSAPGTGNGSIAKRSGGWKSVL